MRQKDIPCPFCSLFQPWGWRLIRKRGRVNEGRWEWGREKTPSTLFMLKTLCWGQHWLGGREERLASSDGSSAHEFWAGHSHFWIETVFYHLQRTQSFFFSKSDQKRQGFARVFGVLDRVRGRANPLCSGLKRQWQAKRMFFYDSSWHTWFV